MKSTPALRAAAGSVTHCITDDQQLETVIEVVLVGTAPQYEPDTDGLVEQTIADEWRFATTPPGLRGLASHLEMMADRAEAEHERLTLWAPKKECA